MENFIRKIQFNINKENEPLFCNADGSVTSTNEFRSNVIIYMGKMPEKGRVAILTESYVEYMTVFVAALFKGISVVPIDYTAPQARINYILKNSDVKNLYLSKSMNINSTEISVERIGR